MQISLNSYTKIIVAFSGGKDSVACALYLLKLGVKRERIELWHQDVDGEGENFMDWPITRSYCQAFAEAMGLTIRFQHKEGGFLREMLREGTRTAPTVFETEVLPGGRGRSGGERGKLSTRRMFPQVSADLSVRWCSAYLKIDVASVALRNDPRFKSGQFLYISGERAEESPARAKYKQVEPHRCSLARRRVDHWRPVLRWTEAEIWDLLAEFKINPHPCYWLGYGRASCQFCIFGDNDQWRTGRDLAPERFEKIAALELEFGKTIHRTMPITERAARGCSYLTPGMDELARVSQSSVYELPIILETWTLPPGAFRHCGGPT